MFVAVEGPNGVGKSTIVACLARELRAAGLTLTTTREPTDSPLGRAVRSMEGEMSSRALALACAADRHYHLHAEVLPTLARGEWVLSDRYLASSLVLQRLDGLPVEEIFEINRGVRPSDVLVYLEADAATLRARLLERGALSRLERTGGPEVELSYYRDAHDLLAGQGWRQLRIDATSEDAGRLAARLARELRDLAA